MDKIKLSDIKKVIGDKFVKIQWQQAHVNEYGLTKTQSDQLAKDILQLIKSKLN